MQQGFEVEGVDYHPQGVAVLSELTLPLHKGKITALLGPNGSGKSSLLRLLAGLAQPSQGELRLEGVSLAHWRPAQLAKRLAMLPQANIPPLGLRVEELIAFGRYPHQGWFRRLSREDELAIEEAMARTELTALRQQPLEQLSGGEMQRCWLAMVLAQASDYLLLDEPTSWLDMHHQLGLLRIVRELNQDKGCTIIWVLHELDQARHFSDEVVLLDRGRLVASGAPQQVLSPDVIAKVFGVRMKQLQQHLVADYG
ncbi:ABC transporter ATP-binding protein [Balneatrix alpica]|uniref:ABC transporter ATP-binding protein n=1 Tax=Balneatrix alpica TaxID=75684 RepID=A0ABV5Z9A4_9GAMM|nr:ABC transporter ATP-binding protein [Balneatrix alpica]